jgi:hypothetical protein
VSPPAGPISANPDELDRYVAALTPADQDLNDALAGLPALVEGWNATPSAYGGRVDGGVVAAVDTAVDELSYLDLWVGRIAAAFRATERICSTDGCPPVIHSNELQLDTAGPPSLAAAVAAGEWAHLFEVVRDGSDGQTRVIRLLVDDRPEGMDPLEWQLLVEELGIAGTGGPLHVVAHGWTTSSSSATGAGEATADLYDQQGVEGATVLVVDWAEGDSVGADPGSWGNFGAAEDSAKATGDTLAPLFTAIAAADPDGQVAITAHSLGNHVITRALSQMDDPSARFAVDYTMVQPAIPARAPTEDTDHYGALVGPRVRDLTITINNGDDALFWYELQGPEALGDEASDGDGLTALLDWRESAGLDTTVVDHDSAAGDGHLGLTPDHDQGLVRSLTQEAIDRVDGGSSPQTGVREWLFDTYDDRTASTLIDHPAVEDYLDRQQAAGEPPTVEDLEALLVAEGWGPRPEPGPVPTPGPTEPPAPSPGPAPSPTPSPSPGPAPTPTPTG